MSKAPNILLVVADQLRARSVGCYGDTRARTPVLDRWAAQGVRFAAAYSTYPVCTPARASIQTGLMPTSCHVVWNNQTLEPVYPSLAESLGAAGYVTAYVGKWHLGGYDGPPGLDYRVPIKPSHRHRWNDLFLVTHGEDYRPGRTPTLVGEQTGVRFNEWQPTWQTDEAIRFMNSCDGQRPWALNLNYALPHTPYLMPGKYRELFDPAQAVFPPNVPNPDAFREELALYNSLTAWLNDEVGRVLAALDSLEAQRKTIIVFAADHGWNLGSHGLPAKFSLYEESACVPLIIAGPGVPPARVCDEPASLIDLMPTLLDFAGCDCPASIQGRSLRPLLTGAPWSRHSIYLQVIDHPQHNLERWDPPAEACARTDTSTSSASAATNGCSTCTGIPSSWRICRHRLGTPPSSTSIGASCRLGLRARTTPGQRRPWRGSTTASPTTRSASSRRWVARTVRVTTPSTTLGAGGRPDERPRTPGAATISRFLSKLPR